MIEGEIDQDKIIEKTGGMIGRKFVLWREDYRRDTYKDQFGRSHRGYVILKEAIVTVIEEKQISYMWSRGNGIGLRAVTEDGVEYTRNWHSYPDDSMTPTYYWDVVEQETDVLWEPVDAYQAYNLKVSVYVKEDDTKAIPSGAQICDTHDRAFQEGNKCVNCYFESLRSKSLVSEELSSP